MIYGQSGCLAGDTIITAKYTGQKKALRLMSIEALYKNQEKIPYQGCRGINKDRGSLLVRSLNEQTMEFCWSMGFVYYSGKKQCYQLTTTTGKTIEATEEHPFFTPNGWKKMSELKIGDSIYYKPKNYAKTGKNRIDGIKEYFVKYHPRNRKKTVRENGVEYSYCRIGLHHAVFEANMNNLTIEDYLSLLNNYDGRELKFIPTGYEIDHIDGDRSNNDISNLQMLTTSEHAKKTYATAQVFSKYIPETCTVTEIVKTTEKDTYDIHCESDNHNFIANNYIVHNTGKTTFALSSKNTLLLDFDNGVHRLEHQHRTDVVQVRTFQDVLDVLQEDLTGYNTVVIDTIGKMLDYIIIHICGTKQPRIQDWGRINQTFADFNRSLYHSGKNVVYVAHRDVRKEGDENVFVPALREKSYSSIVADLDLLGYLEMTDKGRTLTFNPTTRNDGKNTCKLPDRMVIPGVAGKENTSLETLILQPYRDTCLQQGETEKAFESVMKELEHEIALITDAQSANGFCDRIDAFTHVGNSKIMAGQKLNKKCTEIGLAFNRETKRYEPAA
jgi:hypothetical protein